MNRLKKALWFGLSFALILLWSALGKNT